MGAEFLFMDDNARLHRANIVDEYLQSEDITRMDWPAYSPDLNPIEHVWDMLGRRIAVRQPPPTFLPEFRRALLDEWCNILQDQIDNFILSMPRHLPTSRENDRFGVIVKVLAFVRNGRYPERTFRIAIYPPQKPPNRQTLTQQISRYFSKPSHTSDATAYILATNMVSCVRLFTETLAGEYAAVRMSHVTKIKSCTFIAKQQKSEELALKFSEVLNKTDVDACKPMPASTEGNKELITTRRA
ncbi:transposable element Tc3 transposase [Trichonephila clavipes]|nr:transposable element Tc3 transposase [Trichonephila clavipes]